MAGRGCSYILINASYGVLSIDLKLQRRTHYCLDDPYGFGGDVLSKMAAMTACSIDWHKIWYTDRYYYIGDPYCFRQRFGIQMAAILVYFFTKNVMPLSFSKNIFIKQGHKYIQCTLNCLLLNFRHFLAHIEPCVQQTITTATLALYMGAFLFTIQITLWQSGHIATNQR